MNYRDELDDAGEGDYEYDRWVHGHNNSSGYRRHTDTCDTELSGNRTRSSSSVYQLPVHYYRADFDHSCPPFIKAQAKESVSSLLFCHSCVPLVVIDSAEFSWFKSLQYFLALFFFFLGFWKKSQITRSKKKRRKD